MRKAAIYLAMIALILSMSQGRAQDAPGNSVNQVPEQQDAQTLRDQRTVPPQVSREEAIQIVRDAGWMNVDANGNFHADASVTRAELAVALNKAFKLETRKPPQTQAPHLSDVPARHWAASAIQTISRLGIMEGYRDHLFYPTHPVNRAEGLSIMAQAYGVQQLDDKTIDLLLSAYPDADQLPVWSRKAMTTALKNGFVDLDEQNKIRPLQPMTRGDLAFSLAQYYYRLNRSEQPRL